MTHKARDDREGKDNKQDVRERLRQTKGETGEQRGPKLPLTDKDQVELFALE